MKFKVDNRRVYSTLDLPSTVEFPYEDEEYMEDHIEEYFTKEDIDKMNRAYDEHFIETGGLTSLTVEQEYNYLRTYVINNADNIKYDSVNASYYLEPDIITERIHHYENISRFQSLLRDFVEYRKSVIQQVNQQDIYKEESIKQVTNEPVKHDLIEIPPYPPITLEERKQRYLDTGGAQMVLDRFSKEELEKYLTCDDEGVPFMYETVRNGDGTFSRRDTPNSGRYWKPNPIDKADIRKSTEDIIAAEIKKYSETYRMNTFFQPSNWGYTGQQVQTVDQSNQTSMDNIMEQIRQMRQHYEQVLGPLPDNNMPLQSHARIIEDHINRSLSDTQNHQHSKRVINAYKNSATTNPELQERINNEKTSINHAELKRLRHTSVEQLDIENDFNHDLQMMGKDTVSTQLVTKPLDSELPINYPNFIHGSSRIRGRAKKPKVTDTSKLNNNRYKSLLDQQIFDQEEYLGIVERDLEANDLAFSSTMVVPEAVELSIKMHTFALKPYAFVDASKNSFYNIEPDRVQDNLKEVGIKRMVYSTLVSQCMDEWCFTDASGIKIPIIRLNSVYGSLQESVYKELQSVFGTVNRGLYIVEEITMYLGQYGTKQHNRMVEAMNYPSYFSARFQDSLLNLDYLRQSILEAHASGRPFNFVKFKIYSVIELHQFHKCLDKFIGEGCYVVGPDILIQPTSSVIPHPKHTKQLELQNVYDKYATTAGGMNVEVYHAGANPYQPYYHVFCGKIYPIIPITSYSKRINQIVIKVNGGKEEEVIALEEGSTRNIFRSLEEAERVLKGLKVASDNPDLALKVMKLEMEMEVNKYKKEQDDRRIEQSDLKIKGDFEIQYEQLKIENDKLKLENIKLQQDVNDKEKKYELAVLESNRKDKEFNQKKEMENKHYKLDEKKLKQEDEKIKETKKVNKNKQKLEEKKINHDIKIDNKKAKQDDKKLRQDDKKLKQEDKKIKHNIKLDNKKIRLENKKIKEQSKQFNKTHNLKEKEFKHNRKLNNNQFKRQLILDHMQHKRQHMLDLLDNSYQQEKMSLSWHDLDHKNRKLDFDKYAYDQDSRHKNNSFLSNAATSFVKLFL